MTLIPDFDSRFHNNNITYLCGIDEVGRGPLAGPVIAAAVILPSSCNIPGVDDSKKLTALKREQMVPVIREKALTWGIGEASESDIDRINIVQATYLAMQNAVNNLSIQPDYLLVDGNQFPILDYKSGEIPLRGEAVVKGDAKSLSIACASVLAKVHRDRLMVKLSAVFPEYGFEKHKGYGTLQHRQALAEKGISPIHRKTFVHIEKQTAMDLQKR